MLRIEKEKKKKENPKLLLKEPPLHDILTWKIFLPVYCTRIASNNMIPGALIMFNISFHRDNNHIRFLGLSWSQKTIYALFIFNLINLTLLGGCYYESSLVLLILIYWEIVYEWKGQITRDLFFSPFSTCLIPLEDGELPIVKQVYT